MVGAGDAGRRLRPFVLGEGSTVVSVDYYGGGAILTSEKVKVFVYRRDYGSEEEFRQAVQAAFDRLNAKAAVA